jgi:predicted metal-dependent peptidase
VQAAKAAESKMAGNVPGFLKRLLGNLTRPQKDWRALLAEFVEYYNADYAFTPPDRRFSDGDCIMPDFSDPDEEVKKILFWIDTSGSIGDKELNVAYSEIVGAISQFHRLTGYVGFFDHAAYPVTPFEDVDDILKIKPQGGGGTCFEAPFKWVTDNMDPEDVAGIVIFTDGYCSWPNESIANGVPVLWLINNESEIPPWGQHGTFKV